MAYPSGPGNLPERPTFCGVAGLRQAGKRWAAVRSFFVRPGLVVNLLNTKYAHYSNPFSRFVGRLEIQAPLLETAEAIGVSAFLRANPW